MSAFRTLISSLVVGALVTFGAVKAQAAGEVEKIVRQGELKIGYIPSPPGTAKDPKTGELTGFYVDAARTIAEQMGVRPVFIETTWANFVAGLQAGQFDMSIGATFATVKRAPVAALTKPISYLGRFAVGRNAGARLAPLSDVTKR
ncbi:transporter substrate-binding domain-containing protein, partial [Azospirillum brasilense]|nr:transporter substrate-binding domain-containing protein [Azospirillum brasilense]